MQLQLGNKAGTQSHWTGHEPKSPTGRVSLHRKGMEVRDSSEPQLGRARMGDLGGCGEVGWEEKEVKIPQ